MSLSYTTTARLSIRRFSILLNCVVGIAISIALNSAVCGQATTAEENLSAADAKRLLQARGSELTDQELQRVCTASNLRDLNLSGCNRLTNAGVSCVSSLTELESLNLTQCHRLNDSVFEEIAKLQSLRRLDISSTKFSVPNISKWLKEMPNLKELYLREATNPKTKGLEDLTGLTHLDISCERGRISDADFEPLARLKNLKYLNANGSRNYHANSGLTNAGLKHLEGMTSLQFLGLFGHFKVNAEGYNPLFKNLKQLEKLEMGFNWPLKGEDVEIPTSVVHLDLMESFQLRDDAVVNLKNKTGLRTLNLFYCLELTDKSLESLRNLPKLEYLNLGCIRALTDNGLTNLEGNTGLTYLNLGDNDNFSDVGLASLKRMVALKELNLWSIPNLKGEGLQVLQSLPALQTLNLADCSNLTDAAFRNISRSSKLKNLYLDNCTKISDEGISKLSLLSDLQELTLGGCLGITDNSLDSIQVLNSLEYLVLTNCPGLTSHGISKLEKSLPNCEIVRD